MSETAGLVLVHVNALKYLNKQISLKYKQIVVHTVSTNTASLTCECHGVFGDY